MATLPQNITHAAWGVDHGLPTPFDTCVVTDYAESREPQQQYEYDQKGAVCGCVKFDTRISISATIQVPKDITLPTEGSTLIVKEGEGTDGSKVYLITSLTINQTNRDYRKVSLTLERYSNAFSNNNVEDLTKTATAS